MNNQHMKIQMHKQLEKWEQLFASLQAGTTASPPAQIITKLLLRKEQSENFWVRGLTRVLPWVKNDGQTEKKE